MAYVEIGYGVYKMHIKYMIRKIYHRAQQTNTGPGDYYSPR